jgi:hypothetical protein
LTRCRGGELLYHPRWVAGINLDGVEIDVGFQKFSSTMRISYLRYRSSRQIIDDFQFILNRRAGSNNL